MRLKKTRSMRRWLMSLLLLCWIIPVILIIVVMGLYIFGNHFDNAVDAVKKQVDYSTVTSAMRLDNVVEDSRRASSDGVIRDVWQDYKHGESTYWQMYRICENYLRKEYKGSGDLRSATLWFYEDPINLNCSVYSLKAQGDYQCIRTYWSRDHRDVMSYARTLDTRVGFWNRDGRLYMVRNLVDSNFTPYATLVLRVNTDNCFGSLLAIPGQKQLTVILGDQALPLQGEVIESKNLEKDVEFEMRNVLKSKGDFYVKSEKNANDYKLQVYSRMEGESIITPFYGYEFIIAGMVLFLIPLLIFVLHVFGEYVTKPVDDMIDASRQIQQGNLGYQIEHHAKSREFMYLQDSLNRMSARLKAQFEKIYEEEIALRDAKIMALQSNINPHFMNNTLEIINWESRLAGDVKVTKMIEALSTLLDAAMDRRREPRVHLAEEMVYVNAYLYITKERLGKRLQVVNEIPESVMDEFVPRLILQPVIENAVEHGIVPQGSGTIYLEGRKDDQYLYLEITNEGDMTEEDEARVRQLLSPEYDTSKENSGNLGIANVNQRLRIMYGENCGLTIQKSGENTVTATLKIALSGDFTSERTIKYKK